MKKRRVALAEERRARALLRIELHLAEEEAEELTLQAPGRATHRGDGERRAAILSERSSQTRSEILSSGARVVKTDRPFYADFGDWLKCRSPRLFRMLQRSRRALVGVPRLLRHAKAMGETRRTNEQRAAALERKVDTQRAVTEKRDVAKSVAAGFMARRTPQESGTGPARLGSGGTRSRPLYAPFGDWLKPRWPVLYRLLQLCRRGAADVWRRRAWMVPPLLLIACVFLLGFVPPLADYVILIWGGTAFATVMLAVVYVAFRAYESVDALWTEAAALRNTASVATRRAAEQERAFLADVERVAITISERESALETRLGKRLDDTATAAQAGDAELKSALEAAVAAAHAGDAELKSALEAAVAAAHAGDGELKSALEAFPKPEVVNERLAKLEQNSLSLHIVVALRSMRPLWIGASALETLKKQPEVEHGHELIMAVLADQEYEKPGTLAGRTLIEIGTTRENVPAQGSTQKLAVFTALAGMRFVTVDMDQANTKAAEAVLRYLNPSAHAVTALGEAYLLEHAGSLDAVYLDAFDFDHAGHSEERRMRYREILKTDITDGACWKMHEACAEALIARMESGGVVVLDDTWTDEYGDFAGKGKLAMPLLLRNGFSIVARTKRAVALHRTAKAESAARVPRRRSLKPE